MMVSTEDADITFEFLPYTEEEAVDYTLDISDYERESKKYDVLSDEMQPIKYKGQDFLTAKKSTIPKTMIWGSKSAIL